MMVKFARTVIYHHFYSIHSSREKYFQYHKLDELLTNTIKVYKGQRRVKGVSPFHFQSENLKINSRMSLGPHWGFILDLVG